MVSQLYAKTKKNEAEKTRQKLSSQRVIEKNFPVKTDEQFVFFPVKKKIPGIETVSLEVREEQTKPHSLEEALQDVLSREQLDKVITSFDVVGDLAVIQVPEELSEKKKQIGQALLQVHPNLKSVFQKTTGRKGVYRVAGLELLAGEPGTETVYTESGVRMKLDVSKVYFSPRLSHERERVAGLVKPGERVAGLFAGVGPFPLVIASKKKCTVYAVELNPVAVKYLRKNVSLNHKKLNGKIVVLQGDVKKIAPDLPQCDRVLMPLPKGGEDFLDSALACCKPRGVIHFYQFSVKNDLFSGPVNKVKQAAKKAGRQAKVINKKVVRPFSPAISQVVIDVLVE
jgi:tRNA (guanine37-N1)-methyltransferase